MQEFENWEEDIFNLGKASADRLRKDGQKLKDLLRDYQTVFGTEAGQRVLWDLLDQTYVFYPYQQYNASSYGKEGRREIGLYLLAAIGFRPDPAGLSMLTRSLMNIIKAKMEANDE